MTARRRNNKPPVDLFGIVVWLGLVPGIVVLFWVGVLLLGLSAAQDLQGVQP